MSQIRGQTDIATSEAVETYLYEGAVSRLGEVLAARQVHSVFLVCDRDAYSLCGAEAEVERHLRGCLVTRFNDFTPNPRLEDIQTGVKHFLAAPHDVIIGVGGGSALDVAKMISLFAGNEHVKAEMVVRQQAAIARHGPPVIAIPTTSGTGAEVTGFSALYLDGAKHSVAHPFVLPAVAIVDPKLTYSMPAAVTAATGLDALCQAIESMWAVGSTAESQEYAEQALALAASNLLSVARAPSPASRGAMARAAHLAGRAINISKTTAAHAVSYALTYEHGVPHGMAVALTMGAWMVYNAEVTGEDCADPRGPEHVRRAIRRVLAILECPDVASAREWLIGLLKSTGCPTRLTDIGVTSSTQRGLIAGKCNAERMGNNPRQVDTATLELLLASIA